MTDNGTGGLVGRRARGLFAWAILGMAATAPGLGAAQNHTAGGPPDSRQSAIYVNGAGGDDSWSGLCAEWDGSVCGPKATIQAGIDAARPGDTVIISDGIYSGAGNKYLDFGGKPITVRSASGHPSACVIDCEESGQAFLFHTGEGADSVVEGLTIRGASSDLGSVYCNGASPTLRHCTIKENTTTFYGAGVYCEFSSSPTIENCTITENFASRGGGIGCFQNSNPTIINCDIRDNIAAYGAGVWCFENANATLINCTIRGNRHSDYGAGVDCDHSNPTLLNCTITGNLGDYGGGGVHCRNASPTLTHCVISNNAGGQSGGGLSCRYDSSPTLTNCDITGNWAYDSGGGIYSSDSTATLTDCRIQNNTAVFGGGLECLSFSNPLLTNCVITGNLATDRGGAGRFLESSPTLMNCVIGGNAASAIGGGMCFEYESHALLTNCTIIGNTASVGGGIACLFGSRPMLANCILWADTPAAIHMESATPSVTYCDIQGGWSGTGNIDAEPLFRDPDGPDGDPSTFTDNDYRLSPGSPCVDAGNNSAIPADTLDLDADGDTAEPQPFDLAGRPRQVDDPVAPDTGSGPAPVVDMGVYEYRLAGDADGDWIINLEDYARFADCLQGPAGTLPLGCGWADMNIDSHVDLDDFAEFQSAFGSKE